MVVIGRHRRKLRAFNQIRTGRAPCCFRWVPTFLSSEWASRLVVDAEDVELAHFPAVEDAERWDGPASDFEPGAKPRAWTVQASFGQEHDDFTNALDETRRGRGIVLGDVANGRRQFVARLGRYDDAHYSSLALA